MTDPIAALRGQLQQLETRRAGGGMPAEAYEREKARLERELLDHVLAHDSAAAGGKAGTAGGGHRAQAARPGGAAPEPAPRVPLRMAALLATAVIALAVAGYSGTGSPTLIFGQPPVAAAEGNSPHDMSREQFAAAVEQLAAKLKEQPENAEGWATLARSYMQLGEVEQAVPAYATAVRLRGDDARLLVDYADALAVKNGRSLDGEPMKLVERALKIEPDNIKALALAGTAAFNNKDYKNAVRLWERLATVAPPDSTFRQQLQDSIAEARSLGGLGPAPAVAGASPAAASEPGGVQAAAAGATIRGTVRLSPALAAQAAPGDTVFVLARPAEGARMPLAIVRKQVRDLPFEFTLSDAMAMSPAAKLSLFPKIVIDARVSKSGQAQSAPGDLSGRSGVVPNDATGVVVEIGEVVK